jgi:hypothetical protein
MRNKETRKQKHGKKKEKPCLHLNPLKKEENQKNQTHPNHQTHPNPQKKSPSPDSPSPLPKVPEVDLQ